LKTWISYFDSNVAPKIFAITTFLKNKEKEKLEESIKQFKSEIIFLFKNSGYLKRAE